MELQHSTVHIRGVKNLNRDESEVKPIIPVFKIYHSQIHKNNVTFL